MYHRRRPLPTRCLIPTNIVPRIRVFQTIPATNNLLPITQFIYFGPVNLAQTRDVLGRGRLTGPFPQLSP